MGRGYTTFPKMDGFHPLPKTMGKSLQRVSSISKIEFIMQDYNHKYSLVQTCNYLMFT